MDQGGHLGEQSFANLAAQQAPRRGQNDELGEDVEEVHLAFIAPLGEVNLRLLDHHAHVLAEAVGLERTGEEPELLGAGGVVNVEDDTLAKGWHVELVHLLLGHLRVPRLEEVL